MRRRRRNCSGRDFKPFRGLADEGFDMWIHRGVWCLAALGLATFIGQGGLHGAPSPEQRKELANIQKEVTKAGSLVGKKEFDEAEKLLEDLNKQLDKLVKDAEFPASDKTLQTVRLAIEKQRQAAAKGLGKPDPTLVSFAKEIAPILNSKCGECHGGDDPKGRLNLSTIAAMKQGGQSRLPLVVPKNPNQSSLLLRLVTQNPAQRMPKGSKDPLSDSDIQKVFKWISQGASFDGAAEDVPLAELASTRPAAGGNAPKKVDNSPVVINKATGSEKISFTKQIAPSIVNLCIGCHGGNTPRSGLNLTTFEGMMRGGESGRVIVPGNLDASRLWQLVGAGEQPRMPQGQLRITRKFHADLREWILEGAKFDGPDGKTPLRSIVPTDEELLMEKFAKMTAAEYVEMRKKRAEDDWKKTTKDEPKTVETAEVYVYGNANEDRLKQVASWADEHAKALRSVFNIKEQPIFKGKLTVFVCKDRFTYTEFNQSVHNRDTANEIYGHATVTTAYEDAFVAVQDIGDEPQSWHPGIKASVIANITSAYLKRPGSKLPEWIVTGTGLALAAKAGGANSFLDSMPKDAAEALNGIAAPEEIFQDGKFGPAAIGPIGYTLVDFLMKNGGPAKFGQFISKMQSSGKLNESLTEVYGGNTKALGTAYGQAMLAKRPVQKKK